MIVTTHEERGDRRSPLDARLDEARSLRDLTDAAWERAAGKATGYLKQQRFRSRKDHAFRLPEDGAEALARVARVSVAWLRDGKGPREPAEDRREEESGGGDATVAEVALLEALRREPSRWSAEDARAALELVRQGRSRLPSDREAAVARMARFLSAVSRARRDGGPLTFEAVVWAGLGSPDDAEGDRELALLGGVRPASPISTPATGTPARGTPSPKK